jgi:hypothetical protein
VITLEKINRELINIVDDHKLNDNLVGVAVRINRDGVAVHSALIIGVDGDYSLFHFDGDVLFDNPTPTDQWFFCKSLDFVNAEEYSLNFLAHCKTIMKEDTPLYGFLFDGSYYDERGKYFTETGIRNYTTCVGFCIKVISGFMQSYNKYFEFDDWNEDSMEPINEQVSEYFQLFFQTLKITSPHITEDDFRKYYKRITPAEYVASAYLSELPIRKQSIDEVIHNVIESIKSKRLSA